MRKCHLQMTFFASILFFQKYYDENITFSHITIFQYYIVFTICILNVFNRCLDLPVLYSPVYFSKSLQCFHQRLHNTSADIWYTTASKYSCHMVEQKAFYVVIFLHVFTYIWQIYSIYSHFHGKILICLFTLIVHQAQYYRIDNHHLYKQEKCV